MIDETNITSDPDTPNEPQQASAPSAILTFDSLALPDDHESSEFAQQIQALKPGYEHRHSYTFMVCDQLAMRGVAPNATMVRSVGAWGSLGHIQGDVRAWYAGLATRLRSDHARLPEAAKRQANELIEQLWLLTQQVAIKPLDDLKTQNAALTAQIEQLQEQLKAQAQLNIEAVSALQGQIDEHVHVIDDQREALVQTQRASDDLRQALRDRDVLISNEALKTNLERQAWHEDRHRLVTELATVTSNFDACLDQLHKAKSDFLVSESRCALLQDAINAERARLDASNKAHALAIDKFRVDSKSAEGKMASLLSQIKVRKKEAADLRDQLAQSQIEISKLRKDAATV